MHPRPPSRPHRRKPELSCRACACSNLAPARWRGTDVAPSGAARRWPPCACGRIRPAAQTDSGASGSGNSGSGNSGSGSQDNGAPDSGLSGLGSGPPGVPPIAGALLPPTGFDPSQPDLRNHLLSSFGQSGTQPQPGGSLSGPVWQFTPSIAVTQELTDNANQFTGYGYGLGNRRDDAITLITPAIGIVGDTERVRVNLNYSPTGLIYAVNTGYSQYRQQGNGQRAGDRGARPVLCRSARLDQPKPGLRRHGPAQYRRVAAKPARDVEPGLCDTLPGPHLRRHGHGRGGGELHLFGDRCAGLP